MGSLLDGVIAGEFEAFALINRHSSPWVEILAGSTVDVDLIADIPLRDERGQAQEVLALLPFRQIRERGFTVREDDSPLRCLIVQERAQVPIHELIGCAPATPMLSETSAFDGSDDDYAEMVARIIAEEIGRGEGSNFVIRREFHAHTSTPAHLAVVAWFAALLSAEVGAAWTFAVSTAGLAMAGASPEQHLSVMPTVTPGQSVVRMNPIAGTYRHPATGATAAGLLGFLHSVKEQEELFMVVDEELKMMSRICAEGVHVQGPFLKQMAHLTHTEYLLEGLACIDPLDALRISMFAPTITGSPMQSACEVIARHEETGRGYYAGVLALFEAKADGQHSLDAPILIRTAYLDGRGDIRVPVGATLVRHSDPHAEAAETHAKARGVLEAIGAAPSRAHAPRLDLDSLSDVAGALRARNGGLSGYWLREGHASEPAPSLSGKAVVIDAEDDFSAMLAQQLAALGMGVTRQSWRQADIADCDLLVAGPGPGDPTDTGSRRMRRMHDVIRQRRSSGRALLAVCLSHQILAAQLGLRLERLDRPRQGLVLDAEILGRPFRLGHYNTFSAVMSPDTRLPDGVSVSVEEGSGAVSSMTAPGLASVQGHPESVLSTDGLRALRLLAAHAMDSR